MPATPAFAGQAGGGAPRRSYGTSGPILGRKPAANKAGSVSLLDILEAGLLVPGGLRDFHVEWPCLC